MQVYDRHGLRSMLGSITLTMCDEIFSYTLVVDLRLLKEIRLKDADDKETKEFDKWSQESGRNPELCLSLHYGDQFVLKHLSLQGIYTIANRGNCSTVDKDRIKKVGAESSLNL